MKNAFYLISVLLLLNGCSLFQNKPTDVKQATVNNDDIKNALQDAKNQISSLENRIKTLESKETTASSIETVGTCPVDFFDIGGGYCREIKCQAIPPNRFGDKEAARVIHATGGYCYIKDNLKKDSIYPIWGNIVIPMKFVEVDKD